MPTDPRDAPITSVTNPRVKALVALRGRRRARQEQGVTLVEGYEELDLALTAGVAPTELYLCPELSAGDPRDVAVRAEQAGAQVHRLGRLAFEKAAYREGPDGWLAVVPDIETALADLPEDPNPLVVVCGSVEKPGNLGSILRTADAAGVTAVISVDPVTDWGNPNVVRASKGAVFSVPVASCDTAAFLAWARERGLTVVATTPDTDEYVAGLDLSGPTAVLVGSEKHGLSGELLAAADIRAKLPMFGRVDSLNVAVTAAVVTYECVRQRMATGA
ncbi:TrmH family RNA methyltransferase [Phytomonospora endophytica]|uniref:TrmH family RNA methyltransferase n=1 Tax=Phytomonospora endophytica TaxID=714109 RepID=A0A841FIW7_9ACTN|nr:RNA methyltransferase [Phytomonospora endophytica]MBB6036146.1 TrmH family RNA methyltransferase [Phytomonospora endophytica]GIG67049.1 rRNA methyltransferase [Phytomonospora endophytica]